ncbi:hypothetical protein ACYSNR_01020 [Enterococcus sp. LJL128]
MNSYVIKVLSNKKSLGFVTACEGNRITVSKLDNRKALCFLRSDAKEAVKTLPECCNGKIIPASKFL